MDAWLIFQFSRRIAQWTSSLIMIPSVSFSGPRLAAATPGGNPDWPTNRSVGKWGCHRGDDNKEHKLGNRKLTGQGKRVSFVNTTAGWGLGRAGPACQQRRGPDREPVLPETSRRLVVWCLINHPHGIINSGAIIKKWRSGKLLNTLQSFCGLLLNFLMSAIGTKPFWISHYNRSDAT